MRPRFLQSLSPSQMSQLAVTHPEKISHPDNNCVASPEFQRLEKMYRTGRLSDHETPGILRMRNQIGNVNKLKIGLVAPKLSPRGPGMGRLENRATTIHNPNKLKLSPRVKQLYEVQQEAKYLQRLRKQTNNTELQLPSAVAP